MEYGFVFFVFLNLCFNVEDNNIPWVEPGADMNLLDIQKLPGPPSTEKYANLIQSRSK